MIGEILRIRYEVTQELYEHPLFYCYIARDRVAGKNVCVRALKSQFSSNPAFIDKLKKIAQKLRDFRHPNVEGLFELTEHENTYLLIGECSEGQLLSESLSDQQSLAPQKSLELVIQVCQGLVALHEYGIIHGDVSERNIMLSEDNQVRLVMPGLWESLSASSNASFEMFSNMAEHLAPEVHQGIEPNPEIDQYSVGILLFRLLTGQQLFSGQPNALIQKHLSAPVPSVKRFNQAIPSVFDELLKKLLAKNPDDRFLNVKILLSELKRLHEALKHSKPIHLMNTDFTRSNPKNVAPRMEALKLEDKKLRKMGQSRHDSGGGVPKWLGMLVYVGLALLIVLIGSWVYFNLQKPKLVKVPDVIGLNLNDANSRLKNWRLGLKINKTEANEQYPEGTIIGTNPQIGEEIRENSYLFATVSSGSRFVVMPDLRNRTLNEAKSILSSLRLEVEEPVQKVRDLNIEEDKIVSHIPEGRKKVERFSKVRIMLSSGSSGTDSKPSLTNEKHDYSVHITMPEGNEKTLVRVDFIDERGTSTVYEKLHRPLEAFEVTSVGHGVGVTIRIYFNGDLVKEIYKKADHSNQTQAPATKAKKTESKKSVSENSNELRENI